MKAYLVRIFLCLLTCALVSPVAAARTIEFETTQVTAADVALSPDGHWLIFTLLGHLFRLPVEGGTAEQLTFGPYYDTDPVFSPNGTQVAFVSDRDGSDGNVFVLELTTGQITLVTREFWAARPTWTPDGQAIVYLRFVREAFVAETWHSMPALVRRVSLPAGEPETLSTPPRLFRSVFYLRDGRLAWTVIEPKTGSPRLLTRVEVVTAEGTVSTLRTVGCYGDRVAASPIGDGLYSHCSRSIFVQGSEGLLFVPLPEGAERQVLPLLGRSGFAPRGALFAVAADNSGLYLGEAGRLWKIALPSGRRQLISFRARVKLEIQEPVLPLKSASTALGTSVPLRTVMSPRLSPDGRRLVFGAAGYLWEQTANGGQAQRLFKGRAFEREPAFSPDGKQLAFLRNQYGKQEIRVFNFASGETRTLASGQSYWGLSWSPDGQRLVFVERERPDRRVVAVNLSDGKKEELAKAGRWSPRPHFSADGHSLYFSASGTLYRLSLKEKAKPQPVTQLARHLSDGLVSPDGKWLAYRRNTEIWVAPLGTEPVREEHIRQLSAEGGDTFAFTPDGSAVIYAAGNRVWRHPLTGVEREEIPIRLELKRPTPPPLLVRRVRVLDFARGDFSPETSLYIEEGRIRWIGSETGRQLPPETLTLDARGRSAIPGLFDFHAHISHRWRTYQEAFLAYGVTSVRVPGAWHTWLNALVDRGVAASDPLPRYFWADFFEGMPPIIGDADVLIYDEEDARTYVRRSKKWGAHFIKVYPSLSWPLQRAVAKEASKLGLPVAGHGTSVEEVIRSVILGYEVLEHRTRLFDDALQMLAAAGTRWDPTLTAAGGTALLLRDEPERLADAKFRAFIPEGCVGEGWAKPIDTIFLRGDWAEKLASIRAAHRRGVKLQAGTDFGCFYGASLLWELEFFVQAGIPPLEVLRIATQEAAAAVGAEDDLGTLEPGKLADIVLLDKNPLDDIRNTQTIWRVIKGGWLFDPEKLRPPVSTSPDE